MEETKKLFYDHLEEFYGSNIDIFFKKQSEFILNLYNKKRVNIFYIEPWRNVKRSLTANIHQFEKQLWCWHDNQSNPMEMLALTKCAHNVVNSPKRNKLGKKTSDKLEIIKDWFEDLMNNIESFDDLKKYINRLMSHP